MDSNYSEELPVKWSTLTTKLLVTGVRHFAVSWLQQSAFAAVNPLTFRSVGRCLKPNDNNLSYPFRYRHIAIVRHSWPRQPFLRVHHRLAYPCIAGTCVVLNVLTCHRVVRRKRQVGA